MKMRIDQRRAQQQAARIERLVRQRAQSLRHFGDTTIGQRGVLN